MRFIYPESWLTSVVVARGGGGLDRFGNPLPGESFVVDRCVFAPRQMNEDEALGEVSDTFAALYHESVVFEQNDLVTVTGGANEGVWEVQAPSSGFPFGTETRLRRVNQQ